MNHRPILLTAIDFQRLTALLRDAVSGGIARLEHLRVLHSRLDRAEVVDPRAIPADVITMNSTVRLRDLASDAVETYTLVYPGFADNGNQRLSVLAPIGTALIGCRAGDTIEWNAPYGNNRAEIEAVESQPERSGQYDL